ncbi:anti-sigma factor family protein [Sphingopyxis fribergensis]
MSFDPATVAAFVDGELDDLTARRIEREAENNPALAAEIARHRALKMQLTAHYAPVAEEPVPDRLRALLTPDATVDTSFTARREAKRARFAPIHWGAIAASLIIGLTLGLRPWLPDASVAEANGTIIAAGPLAEALDTQLASNQRATAVQISLSFEDRDGRYCRSFESRSLNGIGCREGGRWRLERTMPGQTGTDYRQAASGELAATAAAMMTGDPLDAAAERQARDMGWPHR